MSRATLAWDRVVAVVLGLLLVVGGVLTLLWWRGNLPGVATPLDLGLVQAVRQDDWWPWAVAAAALLLILLGLRWLAGHLPRQGVSELNLSGSGDEGRLAVDAGAVGSGFADAFSRYPAVRSARGTIRRDRGQLVAAVRATVDPDADLSRLGAAADQASADLARMLDRDDLTCRMQVRVGRGGSGLPRVR